MTNLTDLLDFYVKALKGTSKFEGVKFVFSGKVRPAEFPLEHFIVATSVARKSVENPNSVKSVTRATFHLDVYGHKEASKRDVGILCDALTRELSEFVSPVSAEIIEVSEAVYESDLCVWRQQIRLKLSLARSSAQTQDVRIFLDAKPLDLADFREVKEFDYYPLKEVFSGVTAYVDTEDVKRRLLVSVRGEENPFKKTEFDLFDSVQKVTFRGCRIMGGELVKTDSEKIFRYTLTYKEKIYALEE